MQSKCLTSRTLILILLVFLFAFNSGSMAYNCFFIILYLPCSFTTQMSITLHHVLSSFLPLPYLWPQCNALLVIPWFLSTWSCLLPHFVFLHSTYKQDSLVFVFLFLTHFMLNMTPPTPSKSHSRFKLAPSVPIPWTLWQSSLKQLFYKCGPLASMFSVFTYLVNS